MIEHNYLGFPFKCEFDSSMYTYILSQHVTRRNVRQTDVCVILHTRWQLMINDLSRSCYKVREGRGQVRETGREIGNGMIHVGSAFTWLCRMLCCKIFQPGYFPFCYPSTRVSCVYVYVERHCSTSSKIYFHLNQNAT